VRVLECDDRRTALDAAERALLVLVEERGARPAAGFTGSTTSPCWSRSGATWRAGSRTGREIACHSSGSDHFVSEALHLSDPDEHGIEIYRDRPRELWKGQVGARMTTLALDVDDLIGELADPGSAPFDGLPAGTVIGHIHLKVAAIPETVAFYRDAASD
jgi:catechol 2,3-dioxygenase